ncbi:MAG: Yip1 family protein [Ignavibacteriaceae bacterium]
MSLVDRAKNIMVSPKAEWDVIANEEPNIQQLIVGYVLPLALIPTIAIIIGYGLIGIYGFSSFTMGIAMGLVQLLNAILSVFIAAFVIDALAPSFGSQKNMGRAVQLVAYSMTPVWVGGIFNLVPVVGWLGSLLGLYGLYLLYVGISPQMKTPEDKKVGYMIVSIIVLIVVYFVIAAILTAILLSVFGLSMWGAANLYR